MHIVSVIASLIVTVSARGTIKVNGPSNEEWGIDVDDFNAKLDTIRSTVADLMKTEDFNLFLIGGNTGKSTWLSKANDDTMLKDLGVEEGDSMNAVPFKATNEETEDPTQPPTDPDVKSEGSEDKTASTPGCAGWLKDIGERIRNFF